MKEWTKTYHDELQARIGALKAVVPTRLAQITDARTTPALDDMPIGSAKRVRAAALFFDIEGFTSRTVSDDEAEMTRALEMLNYVIPTIMGVIYDHGGYIEKNTGDGVMALFIADGSEADAVASALDAAVTCFFILRGFVNPHLVLRGIAPVNARIGVDFGPLLISKIGVPTGSADHPRNFLTAVGPTANIACRLHEKAGTNQIWVGDLVYGLAPLRRDSMLPATPQEWPWIYRQSGGRYWVWHFNEIRVAPLLVTLEQIGALQPVTTLGNLGRR